MKKLLLSLATVAMTGFLATAETVNFNFNQDPAYGFEATTDGNFYEPAKEISEGSVSIAFGGNYRLWNYSSKSRYEIRLASGSGTMTFSVPAGNLIKSIALTGANLSTKYSGLSMDDATVGTDGYTVTGTNTDCTYTFADGAQKILFPAPSARVDVLTAVVTYETAGPATLLPCGLKWSATSLTLPVGEVVGNALLPKLENPNNLTYTTTLSNDAFEATIGQDGQLAVTKVPADGGECVVTCSFAGNDTYKEGSAVFTLMATNPTANFLQVAEKGAADASLPIAIGFNSTVVYVNGQNCYLVDSEGNPMLLYGNTTFQKGDVLEGNWNCLWAPYSIKVSGSLPQVIETGKEVVYPVVEASALETTPLNTVCTVSGIEFAEATPSAKANFTGVFGSTSLTFRNNFTVESVEAGTYDVTCAVACYNTTRQYYPIVYTQAVEEGMQAPKVFLNDVAVEYTVGPNELWGGTQYNGEATFKEGEIVNVSIQIQRGLTLAIQVNDVSVDYKGSFDVTENTTIACYATDGYDFSDRVVVNIKFEKDVKVETVEAAEPATFFDLQGRAVENPANGMFIRVANGKATKVVLK